MVGNYLEILSFVIGRIGGRVHSDDCRARYVFFVQCGHWSFHRFQRVNIGYVERVC